MNGWHPSLEKHGWQFAIVVLQEYPAIQNTPLELPPLGITLGTGIPIEGDSLWKAREYDGYQLFTLPAYDGRRYGHAKYRLATPDEEAAWRLGSG